MDELQVYIQARIAEGMARPDIESLLSTSGWQGSDVAAAFARIEGKAPPISSAQPAPVAPEDFLKEMEQRRTQSSPISDTVQTSTPKTPLYAQRATSDIKGIPGFLIRRGVAKDEPQANLVMVGVVAVCLGIIIWNFFF